MANVRSGMQRDARERENIPLELGVCVESCGTAGKSHLLRHSPDCAYKLSDSRIELRTRGTYPLKHLVECGRCLNCRDQVPVDGCRGRIAAPQEVVILCRRIIEFRII